MLVADVHFPYFKPSKLGNCLMMDMVHAAGNVSVDIRDSFYITSKTDTKDTVRPILIQLTPLGLFWTKVYIDVKSTRMEKVFVVLTIKEIISATTGADAMIFAMDNVELHAGSCDKLQGNKFTMVYVQ